MFILNVGYQWKVAGSVEAVNGLLYLPTGNTIERLTRSALPECQRRLFDPQLYLAELNATLCPTTCSRLATFPWFQADIPAFDSSERNQRDWLQGVKARIPELWRGAAPDVDDGADAAHEAVRFQVGLSCTHIILPSPLIGEREDEAFTQAQWLDHGLAAVDDLEVGQPVLATVAVSEGTLNDAAFADGGFLDTIVDQITSREGVDGVYLLVAQTHANHPFVTDRRVLRAYLHLSRAFRQAGYTSVMINFAGVFGQVCLGIGASGFAAGHSHSTRRLSLEGFDETRQGRALPKFFSRRTIGEYLSESHLDPIVARRLVRRVRDVTPYSEALMAVLASGGSAAQLPEWAESQNNTTAASMHFIARLATDASEMSAMGMQQRDDQVREWLENAAANALYVTSRMEDAGVDLMHAPVQAWIALLDEIS